MPGTPASAPVDPKLRKKALWTTLWATVAFVIVFAVIELRIVTLEELSYITPPSQRGGE